MKNQQNPLNNHQQINEHPPLDAQLQLFPRITVARLGLQKSLKKPGKINIFAFRPHQARTYTHHTCHNNENCKKINKQMQNASTTNNKN